jgi:hypothetical protein
MTGYQRLTVSLLIGLGLGLFWANRAMALPCQEMSSACVDQLTELAIANSPEYDLLARQVTLAEDQLSQTRNRRWTHFLTLDPLRLGANLLGGGDVGRARQTATELELQRDSLAQRQTEINQRLQQSIANLLLQYEQQQQQENLATQRLDTHQQRLGAIETEYLAGNHTLEQMLPLWERTDELKMLVQQHQHQQQQTLQTLRALVGIQDP